MKTKKEWDESGLHADRYMQPGDEIDEELYLYFAEVVPPYESLISGFMMGEPVDEVNGEYTFMCFTHIDEVYRYMGELTEGQFFKIIDKGGKL